VPAYIVAFETASQTTRAALKEKLKSYGTYCPINEYCWAVVTDQNAVQIRDYLLSTLAPTDRLFVIRSGTEAAWHNAYGDKNNAWLKQRL